MTCKPWLFLGVVVAISATACSGSSSPTGPSSASGAQIAGRVSGVPGVAATASTTSLASSALTQASSTTGSLKVSVNGTNIETTLDGTGRFTLNGVPAGTIVLNFTGRGVDASVTIRGVNTGDQIDIEVNLAGGRARLESEHRRRGDGDGDDDDDDGLTEMKGAVSELGGACPSLTFKIGMRPVTTNSATIFEDITCLRVQNMMRVEVKGQIEANGSLTAKRIERED